MVSEIYVCQSCRSVLLRVSSRRAQKRSFNQHSQTYSTQKLPANSSNSSRWRSKTEYGALNLPLNNFRRNFSSSRPQSNSVGRGKAWLQEYTQPSWKKPPQEWLLEKQLKQKALAKARQVVANNRQSINEGGLSIKDVGLEDTVEERAKLSGTALSLYTVTSPPTPAQLRHATTLFTTQPPNFLHGTAQFRTFPMSSVPEVAFIGRSNVGKSSLLNAIFGRSTDHPIAWTSKHPGRTREMNAFGVNGIELRRGKANVKESATSSDPSEISEKAFDRWVSTRATGGLVVLDMPGYGAASREEWGREITKYLSQRRQLRRVFVLIHGEHGLKDSDRLMLRMLREHAVPHQIILTKVDKLLPHRNHWKWGVWETVKGGRPWGELMERAEEVRKAASEPEGWRGSVALGDVLITSAELKTNEPGAQIGSLDMDALGVNRVRWAILQAAGMDVDEKGRKRVLEWAVQPEEIGDADGRGYEPSRRATVY